MINVCVLHFELLKSFGRFFLKILNFSLHFVLMGLKILWQILVKLFPLKSTDFKNE